MACCSTCTPSRPLTSTFQSTSTSRWNTALSSTFPRSPSVTWVQWNDLCGCKSSVQCQHRSFAGNVEANDQATTLFSFMLHQIIYLWLYAASWRHLVVSVHFYRPTRMWVGSNRNIPGISDWSWGSLGVEEFPIPVQSDDPSSAQFCLVWHSLKHKALRRCRVAGRGGFLSRTETVL